MATNDFQPFGIAAGSNVMSQADYLALTARLSGFASGTANSAQLNKVWRQASVMAYVLAQYISDATRQDVLDNGTPATILANLKSAYAAGGPAAGSASNVSMLVSTASATATLAADEVVVKTALAGSSWILPSFSKVINLGTTGAGGMDTGAAPVNGFVAVYAIYNPTTGVSALLGVNATSTKVAEVYGGANMPAGYTASALMSVWPTNASSQFKIGSQRGRSVSLQLITLLTTSVAGTGVLLSLSSFIPPNATSIGGEMSVSNTTANIVSLAIGANSNFTGQQAVSGQVAGITLCNFQMALSAQQSIYYTCTVSSGTPTAILYGTSYSF